MGTVLAMLELDGPTDALLAAGGRLEQRLGTPAGLLARIVAPTATGIALWQLWASREARERNASDPGHAEALRASGMTALVTGSRSRTFEDASLQVFPWISRGSAGPRR
jgi:hypothetical protein